ncbi:hypothetical protein C6A37_01405 [Desulfobacteraceae bacterium SEEP-SAG9]|nr:hypothetical protein C6A37_01405 [Desulfobacteraceae bacterium SEEP-SAG9]
MSEHDHDEEFKGIEAIAKKLGVPKSWIYTRTMRGEIPFYKIGKYLKFLESEVVAWVKEQR